MNWLQGFPYCLTQSCAYGDGASILTVSSYCSGWEQFHWLHVHETSPYWSHTAWRKRGWEREKTGCGQKNLNKSIYVRLSVSLSCSLHVECRCHWYLIVHDCSQAHDAHVHIIFLAHEAGVLDGFAVWNWAIAAIDEIQQSDCFLL